MAAEQSNSSGFAARYATALFELAKESHAVPAVLADLDRFDALIGSHPDMHRFVMSPVFGADEQIRALTPILEKVGISGLAHKFLLLVASKRRLFAIRPMVKAFKALVDKDRGVTRATVTLAETLALHEREVATSREIAAGYSLDDLAALNDLDRGFGVDWQPNLRWIMVHMIEEYARHCGHADFIRERIDGATGD